MKVGGRLNLDKVGAFASMLCAIHCLLTGVALGVLSVLGLSFIGSTITDVIFLSVTLSIASIAIFVGILRHKSLVPMLFFLSGVAAIIVSHFVLDHDSKDMGTRILTTVFAVLGGLLLVTCHVINLRLQSRCKH